MKFDLVTQGESCPFRNDIEPYLHRERVREILEGIFDLDQSFSCHKHNEFGDGDEDEDEVIHGPNTRHCAGALILLEKNDTANQMMRIAERLGFYDRRKLKMDAPVFNTAAEMLLKQT